jgi:hypothetical protein
MARKKDKKRAPDRERLARMEEYHRENIERFYEGTEKPAPKKRRRKKR